MVSATGRVALLRSFADQATIAVNNARLLREIEERNPELSESLEAPAPRPRARSSSSSAPIPGDLATVLDAVRSEANRLCGGDFSGIWRNDGDVWTLVSTSESWVELLGRTISDDRLNARATRIDDASELVRHLELGGPPIGSLIAVPLLDNDGTAYGSLHVGRTDVRPFGPSDEDILQTFADQAAVAIGNAKLFNDLDAALERQTAMTDVLEAVGTSRVDIQPVFDAVAHHADRLCAGSAVAVLVPDGNDLRVAALGGLVSDLQSDDFRYPADSSSMPGDAFTSKRLVHVRSLEEAADRHTFSPARERIRAASRLCVPMIRVTARRSVSSRSLVAHPAATPTTRSSLLKAFTDQAAIAVDNARLLREIEERNTELSESLELQTATSEALRLISTHPGDLTTVLDAIVSKAASLCDAPFGSVLLKDGPVLRIAAANIDELDMAIGMEFPADDGNVNTHAARSNTALAFDDLHVVAPELAEQLPNSRSYATVALFSEAEWIGNINILRPEVRPFDKADLAILQAFADQASLAVSNARLFNDLDAALERQTAMTDVLEAVSTARLDLQPVFDRIAIHAHRLAQDGFSVVQIVDGDEMVIVGTDGYGTDWIADSSVRRPIDRKSTTGFVIDSGEPLHIRQSSEVTERFPGSRLVDTGLESWLILPMKRDGNVIGAIGVARPEPGGYDDAEIALLRAFTDQAAIAVDNARLLREIEERNHELSDSLELQTASSEVLQLISSNPGDLTLVLEGIITRAAALCDAETGLMWLERDGVWRCEAEVGADVSFVGDEGAGWGTLLARDDGTLRRTPTFLDDIRPVMAGLPLEGKTIESGVRSMVAIPLVEHGDVIGLINVGRREIRPFDEKQATILQAFADQAAIAVANAKLFNDLDAALERQTAMTDVLDAVSTARLDLQPVFDTIAHHADRLADGTGAVIALRDGDEFFIAAVAGPSPVDAAPTRYPLDGTTVTGDAIIRGEVTHITGWTSEWTLANYPNSPALVHGHQSGLVVPMMREGAALGAIVFTRENPGGYTDETIALLESFADQATIAVNNARLLQEIEERNADLSESLELQTATSDVLKLISANPGDLDAVFGGIVGRAARLCGANQASIMLKDGDILRISATSDAREIAIGMEFPADEGNVNTTAATTGEIVAVDDFHDLAPELADRFPDIRSWATVALFNDRQWIGNLLINRDRVRPFSADDLKTLQAFADQAAIAVANAQLFNDLDAALERQTAMTEVLDAVSQARLDLQPVFDKVAEHADRLCHGTGAMVLVREGDGMLLSAIAGPAPVESDRVRARSLPIDETSVTGAAVLRGEPVHVRDWDDESATAYTTSPARRLSHRSALAVPMMRGGVAIGAVAFTRPEPGGYAEDEISLLETFADQAAIAVDNARLLREIEERNSALSESLELQTATSEILQLISANPGDLDAVFAGIVEQAARLCDGDGAAVMRRDGDEFVTTDVSCGLNGEEVGFRVAVRRTGTTENLCSSTTFGLGCPRSEHWAGASSPSACWSMACTTDSSTSTGSRYDRSSPAMGASSRRSPSRRRSPSPTPTSSAASRSRPGSPRRRTRPRARSSPR